MGEARLRVWRVVHGFKDPVVGTLEVTDIEWSGARITLIGVLSAPGLAPRACSHTTSLPGSRHIGNGMAVPVLVDRARPAKVKVLWKQMPTERDFEAGQRARAMQQAADKAARMNECPGSAGRSAGSPGASVGGAQQAGAELAGLLGAAIAEALGAKTSGAWGQAHVHVEVGDGARPIHGALPGSAVVRAAHEVPLPSLAAGVVPGGLVDLVLEVTSLEVAATRPQPYTAHTRLAFSTPRRRAAIATPGTRLPVRIDPADRSRVVIDTAALDLPE